MRTRERMLTATRELLWERGYAATSPRDIQRAAAVGQGSMYHHFAGKQELAAEALRQSAEEMLSDAAKVLAGPGTAVERIEGYLRRQRDCLRGCRIGRMTFDPEVVASDELLAPVTDTLDWLVGSIAEVIREGEFAEDLDAEQLASTIVAVVQGGYVLARAQGRRAPFDAAVEGAISLLRKGQR